MSENRKWKIYAYINQINQKLYIGQTCLSLNERAGKNGIGYRQCHKFYRAIQKYGWESFTPMVIVDGLSREEANIVETELIKKYDTTNSKRGYNISLGGNDNTFTSIDITGQRFGKLVALELVNNDKRGRYWLCQCDCGNTSIVRQEHLRNGTTKACSCGLATKKTVPNKAITNDNYVTVFTNGDHNFLIDRQDYEIIKNYHWYYDAVNHRIVNTAQETNILKFIFPNIKRNKVANYVSYKNNNPLDFRRKNLEVLKKNPRVSDEEWVAFLAESNGIRIIPDGINKKWQNPNTHKTYESYFDAKNDLKGSD